MNTKKLLAALEIIARHSPKGEDVCASHDQIAVAGKLPLTPMERAELRRLGFMWDESEECWLCFT